MITPLSREDVPRVVAIHREALGQDLLPSLGAPFLECLYLSMLDSSAVFGFVAKVDGQPRGFVLATTTTTDLFKNVLRRSGFALLRRALSRLLARPRLALSAAETLLYTRRVPPVPVEAELLVIAIEPAYRNGLWAAELVKALNGEFVRRGKTSYKVTVHESNTRATRFYEKKGFELKGQFQLTGHPWCLYTLDLSSKGS